MRVAHMIAAKGDLSHIPIRDICSPKKFNDKGIPVLAKVNIKNNIVNTGIYVANPLK